MSPGVVDVATDERSVVVRVVASDEGSGLPEEGWFAGSVQFSSPGVVGDGQSAWGSLRVTGDPGVLEATVTFGPFVEGGTWTLSSVEVRDVAGNSVYYREPELWSAGLLASVEVLRDGQAPPQPQGTTRITGTLRDRQGEVVPGVLLRLETRPSTDRGWREVRTSSTDRAGRFVLDVDMTAPSQRRLVVSPPPGLMGPTTGLLPVFAESLTLPGGPEETEQLTLDLVFPATDLAGIVRDLEGRPLGGVVVRPEWIRTDEWRAGQPPSVITGPDGAFALAVSPSDRDLLALRFIPGHRADARLLPFTIDPLGMGIAARTAIDASFPPPEVSGLVLRREGSGSEETVPVRDARVAVQEFYGEDGSGWWGDVGLSSARTDAQGRFWLRLPEPSLDGSRWLHVRVPQTKIPGIADFRVPLDPERMTDLEVVFPEPNIAGIVRDPVGAIVAGAHLELERLHTELGWTWWSQVGVSGSTDDLGRFWLHDEGVVERIASGIEYRLQVSPGWGAEGAGLAAFSMPLEPGMDLSALDVRFPAPNVAGVVRDADGSPVRHVHLSLERKITQFGHTYWTGAGTWASTDRNGAFWMFATDIDPALTYRLAVQWWGSGTSYSFNVPIVPGSAEAIGMEIDFPPPNVSGILRADLGEGLVPVADASIEVLRRETAAGYREWVGVYGATAADGSFALYLPPDLPQGDYELRIRAPWSLRGLLPAFSFAIPSDAESTGLEPVFPEPDMSGIVLDPTGAPVRDASLGLERREVDPDGSGRWVPVDWFGQTGPAGRFSRSVDGLDPTASYRLRVHPPHGPEGRALAEFVHPLLPGVSAIDLELQFPEPDLILIVLDPTGVPVRNAWLSLTLGNGDGEWPSEARWRDTAVDGMVAFHVGESRSARIHIDPPGNRGDLVRFEITIDAAQLGGAVELRFPSPNVSGRFVDQEGRDVPHAWFEIEMLDADGEWTWTWWSRASDAHGRFALLIEDPGSYRMTVSPPWRSRLPGFSVMFTINVDGTVEGLDGSAVIFPEPDLIITVIDASADPVMHANVWLQVWGEGAQGWRQVSGGATTGRDGTASFLLGPGRYRAVVSPPWYADGLVGVADEFELTGSEGLVERSVALGLPNVVGRVELEPGLPAAWASIFVASELEDAFAYWSSTHARPDGRFHIALPEGEHTLRIWSGTRYWLPSLDVVVIVDASSELSAWRYAEQPEDANNCVAIPCTLEVSFTAEEVRPNLAGRVLRSGAPLSRAFLTARSRGSEWTVPLDAEGRFAMRVPGGVGVTLVLTLVDGPEPVTIVLESQVAAGDLDVDLTVP